MRTACRTLIVLILVFCAVPVLAADNWIPLAGKWRFALDVNNAGVKEKWFEKTLDDTIQLPGTTDENSKGTLNNARETTRLTRLYPLVGSAWYQQDINVPTDWSNKCITLFLERTKNSRLWVDGNGLGTQNSLVTPHIYSLGPLSPGRHQLTLRINNSEYPPIGDPHQISDQTQTNWNGAIGKIGLIATDPVYIDDVQVYPDVAAKTIRVRVAVVNTKGLLANSTLTLNASKSDGTPQGKPVSIAFPAGDKPSVVEVNYPLGDTAQCWDEFAPVLYRIAVSLDASSAGKKYAYNREVVFGLREFKAKGTQFNINGKTTLLRGKHDACVFPLTGYPPMTVDGWLKVFNIAKSYGINHYRFHTWCPPEAAFEAADQLGIYMEPELPNWANFGEPNHDNFCLAEGERLLKMFGNHPSFVMLSLGNELGGKQELMAPVVKHFRQLDSRHLYAQGTNNWFGMVDPNDDFWVSWQVRWQKIRGSYAAVDTPLGHIQIGPPGTEKDYAREIKGITVPVVSTEIGQYQIYPDYREIDKYTGVVRARNFEIFRDRLKQNGMLDQADDFFRASGALAVLCYREDIEATLRTPGFGGFQLLDLQDFPGQGTALVGILDAFMDSKGLIEPAKWRQFCSETVPLIRMSKYTWTVGETFNAKTRVAHFGSSDINDAVGVWTLQNAKGDTLASGRLPSQNISQGTLVSLGDINIPLKDIASPAKLKLTLAIEGTKFTNSYNIWVYPDKVDTSAGNVIVSRKYDDAAREALNAGKSVLLIPEANDLENSLEGTFASDFWNYGMFKKLAEERKMPLAPGTLGILCDPNHPAFADFPTEFHSNWQWFNLLRNSRTMILDAMPAGYRPIVQVIDNLERAKKLGNVFEVKMGKGKLLVCSINLPAIQDKPEARQLLHSLLRYMNSDRFVPATAIDETTLRRILE
ncbi:MAG: sugar-binding domain-containing protein [Sedimentisphaerales bacterium]